MVVRRGSTVLLGSREALSLKMGSLFLYSFFVGLTFCLMLIGWHAANMSSMSSGEHDLA